MTRSYLGKYQSRENADADQIARMASAAWHQRRGLWIPDGYARNEIEIEFFEALGNQLYGRR